MHRAVKKNCLFRNEDGDLMIACHQAELGNTLGFPVRRGDGQLYGQGRSWVPDEYADGWKWQFPWRDESGILVMSEADDPDLDDCWPETITPYIVGSFWYPWNIDPKYWTNSCRIHTFRLLDLNNFKTFNKVAYQSRPHSELVTYELVETGNLPFAGGDFAQAEFNPSGIDWTITIRIKFYYKDSAHLAVISDPWLVLSEDEIRDPLSVVQVEVQFDCVCTSNPSAINPPTPLVYTVSETGCDSLDNNNDLVFNDCEDGLYVAPECYSGAIKHLWEIYDFGQHYKFIGLRCGPLIAHLFDTGLAAYMFRDDLDGDCDPGSDLCMQQVVSLEVQFREDE